MKKTFPAKAFASWLHNWYRNTIRHPKYRWWIILGSLVYLLDPFDLSPDMLPIVGWIDDGLIATVLVTEVSQLLSSQLKAQKNKAAADNTSPKSLVVDVDSVSIS